MTARLAVLGNPVAQSRSPQIHDMFGRATGIDLTYERLLVPSGEFAAIADEFMRSGAGFNVTVPAKHDAWRWVEIASDRSNQAQAVNTVSRDQAGRICGDTTDGRGLVRDLCANLGWRLDEQRVLVLGAGGAVSSVLADLVAERPAVLHLYNRTMGKAEALADRIDGVEAVTASQLGERYDVIINGTSAGLAGDTIALPASVVGINSRCYDMIYGQAVTHFNQWCLEAADCQVSDGLGMLVEQAALAFETWFGVLPATVPVISAMRAAR